jgi:hypothetical protein
MDCQITNYLISYPPDLFLRSVLGKFEKIGRNDDIKTLLKLSSTCKLLSEKVTACWETFIKQSSCLLLFSNSLHLQKSYEEVIKTYIKLNKLQPEIEEKVLHGFLEQCIVLRDSTLCIGTLPRSKFFFINLADTKSIYEMITDKTLGPMSYTCVPPMISTKTWMAVCCESSRKEEKIVIINEGKVVQKITNIGRIFQLDYDEQFLYVLSKDSSHAYSVFKYDGNDWNAMPLKFSFCNSISVNKFCLFGDDIIFYIEKEKEDQLVIVKKEQEDQLFIVKKEELSNDSQFINNNLPKNSILKIFGKDLLVFNHDVDKSTAILTRFYIQDLILKTEQLQVMSVSSTAKIRDFYIHLGKIFLLNDKFTQYTILCYDLNGTLLNEFTPANPPCFGTNFLPQLVQTGERIQLLYSATICKKPGYAQFVTILYNLNYKA